MRKNFESPWAPLIVSAQNDLPEFWENESGFSRKLAYVEAESVPAQTGDFPYR
jgi:hypothetical protein